MIISMKSKRNLIQLGLLAVLLSANFLHAQGTTAFTYQGRLNAGASAANGSYDMTFAVYDANVAGNQIAGPITNSAVAVTNGLFTVSLDFGLGVFTGTNYWVQMAVSPAGANTFAALTPRQQLTPAPYALSLVSPQAYGLCPPGSVMAYMGTTAPPGWLMCDGSVVSRTQYAALFAAIGQCSGTTNLATFFLPDLRGVFLRGVDNGAGRDPDAASRLAPQIGANQYDAVGSYQADMFASHTHGIPASYGAGGSGAAWPGGTQGYSTTTAAGGNETRPKNVYVNYIIKY
jgi:microcystin-dependent protein